MAVVALAAWQQGLIPEPFGWLRACGLHKADPARRVCRECATAYNDGEVHVCP